MTTLWNRWKRNASAHPARHAIVHWRAGEAPYVWSWGDLVDEASRYAVLLREVGIARGHVCALMLSHHPSFYPIYMGLSALGAVPSVLAYPNPRLHQDKFIEGLTGMAARSGLAWLLTQRDLQARVEVLALQRASTIRKLVFPLEFLTAPIQPEDFGGSESAHDACLLQHSSGTTGLQKAVVLSHEAVLGHIDRYGSAISLRDEDRIASWLPLYHDMGLIAAFHLPLAMGLTTIQIDPFEWVSMPALLLQAISMEQATLCWMPNFAFNFLAERSANEDLVDVTLASMRMFINCSEPVRAESFERFIRRFAPYGVRENAMSASYAMAETTFAVTQTPASVRAMVVELDREALSLGQCVEPRSKEAAKSCVSSGRLVGGCEIRLVGEQGDELGENLVGDLVIRSASMFDGYRNDPDGTAAVLNGDWYSSGDYGFRRGDEYFIIGRKKDLIIVAGKNLHPEDIEVACSKVPGVLPGRLVAFGREDPGLGTECVCIVVESDLEEPTSQRELRIAVQRAAMAIDVTVSQVYIAKPRWLIKTSSGKLSRSANRDRVLRGELRDLAT